MKTGYPSQIKYIVGNEAAERFSYYGMRGILVVFMTHYLMIPDHDAKGIYHLFITANYFLPLFGGYLSDRYLGKYRTIVSLSLFYCAGHAVLAAQENQLGLYLGLALIALGSGGIKPCVSAHVGDQFNATNSHLLKSIYEIFYFSINFGAFFSTLLTPKLLVIYGPSVAFGVPGVLMFIATYVFWLGKKHYVHVPPTGKAGSAHFLGILYYALTHLGQRKAGESWLDTALAKYPDEKVDGAKAAVAIFNVFIWVSAFWALFEQNGSSWILQASQMNLHAWGYDFEASQIPALNPIMVMLFVPLFSLIIYPAVSLMGIKVTPLRRMGAGMLLTATAFICAAAIQNRIDAGHSVSILWQFPQYILLTAAEVMVSITGLEFAYTQAPRAMKSTIMSLWLLTVTLGNFCTAIISFLNKFKGMEESLFYAAIMFGVSLIFIWSASRYKERYYIEGRPA